MASSGPSWPRAGCPVYGPELGFSVRHHSEQQTRKERFGRKGLERYRQSTSPHQTEPDVKSSKLCTWAEPQSEFMMTRASWITLLATVVLSSVTVAAEWPQI